MDLDLWVERIRAGAVGAVIGGALMFAAMAIAQCH